MNKLIDTDLDIVFENKIKYLKGEHVIDNFGIVKKIIKRLEIQLNLKEENELFNYENYIQILERGKDNKEKSNSKNRRLLSFYTTGIDGIEKRKDLIKLICDTTESRAYINLNLKNKKRLAYKLISEITRKLYEMDINGNESFPKIDKIVNTTYGKYGNTTNLWLIDVDFHEIKLENLKKLRKIIRKIITKIPLNGRALNEIYYGIINTKNGVHIITSGFNINEFNKQKIEMIKADSLVKEIDIKKQPLTLLYM